MGLTIFGASNPQPIAYTGAHLRNLEGFYTEKTGILSKIVGARLMIVGAAVRMVADTIRYTSHAVHDCWLKRKATPLALNSLVKAGHHLLLAITTLAFGILSPSLIIKIAARVKILPSISLSERILSSLKTAGRITLIFGAMFCMTRIIGMSEAEISAVKALGNRFNAWAKPVIDIVGERNWEAAGLTAGIGAGAIATLVLLNIVVTPGFRPSRFSL